MDRCESVLKRAVEGTILIVTSALTLAEVLNIRGMPAIPPSDRQMVINFFKNDYINVRNVTRQTAEIARTLVWDNAIKP